MINKTNEMTCAVCGACEQVCPKKCISFRRKYKSFLYPVIDAKKCIKCDLCEGVCPAIHIPEERMPLSYYAAKNKESSVLMNSSSGGVFYPLSEYIISQNGYVCGATFDSEFNVHHNIISSIEEIRPLCGSKYVQSNTDGCYEKIKKLLKEGKKVLFAGCPCQSAALRNYIGSNSKNLFIVDFICHGSVSAEVFEEYKKYLEKKYRGRITRFSFRHKEKGWLFSGLHVEFDNGLCYDSPLSKDVYMQGYFKNLNLKECCFNCAYKGYHSGSDITLGDFWGAQDLLPDFYDYYGNSVVIINSVQGRELFEQIKHNLHIKEISENDVLTENSGLITPFPMSSDRESYFKNSMKHGYIKPLEKYVHSTLFRRIYAKSIRIIPHMKKI